jgi:hypothetical protein
MNLEIIEVKIIPKYHGWLLLTYSNSELRIVDIKPSMKGILTKLSDHDYFKQVFVDQEAGTIAWPNDIHIDPDTLYERSYSFEEMLVDFFNKYNIELA